MFAANVFKYFFRRAAPAVCYVVQGLANTFVGISARSKIQQALVRLGVLHNSGCFPLYREYNGTLTLLQLFKKVG
jgi:hypothetical protein